MTYPHHETSIDLINIAGVSILSTTSVHLLELLQHRHQQSIKSILLFANSNFIVNARSLFKSSSLGIDNVLIANDGIALNIASKLIHGKTFHENLNGTDFSPFFLLCYPEKLNIFLLGAKPEVVLKAQEYVELHFPRHQVVGVQDGYFDHEDSGKIVSKINTENTDILLVAMGNPIQEQWILANQHLLNSAYIFGVGALFDFWSGNKIRAPLVIQKLRLEWLFRLCQEPRRLLKRYSVDIIKFLYIAVKESKSNLL